MNELIVACFEDDAALQGYLDAQLHSLDLLVITRLRVGWMVLGRHVAGELLNPFAAAAGEPGPDAGITPGSPYDQHTPPLENQP